MNFYTTQKIKTSESGNSKQGVSEVCEDSESFSNSVQSDQSESSESQEPQIPKQVKKGLIQAHTLVEKAKNQLSIPEPQANLRKTIDASPHSFATP